jgi:uncharacterized protein with HEPN domain
MPLEEADLKFLWDMLEAARDASTFVVGVDRVGFLKDRMRQRAVERVVELIGEAARRISQSARDQLRGVQWGAIVATRHILAHDYREVDLEKIWRIATIHVPILIAELTPVLAENPPGPESGKDPGQP